MRAVIYARVSTVQNQTVDNQLDILREVAKSKGYTIVKEYCDEGISDLVTQHMQLGVTSGNKLKHGDSSFFNRTGDKTVGTSMIDMHGNKTSARSVITNLTTRANKPYMQKPAVSLKDSIIGNAETRSPRIIN